MMKARGVTWAVMMGSMLLAVTIAGCGGLELQSHWRAQEITIDGKPMDWEGVPTTYAESPNIAFRVLNDDSNMYVSMASPDDNVLGQIIDRGITVWFDPEGEMDKVFGIRWPGQPPGEAPGQRPDPASMRQMMQDPSKMKQRLLEMIDEPPDYLELVGPNEVIVARLPVTQTQDIKMALGYQSGWFICELKVPLYKSDDHPYAVGAEPDKKIAMGFTTPEIDREAMMKAMRPEGGPPGDMNGGGEGGMGGSTRGGPPPGMAGGRRMMQPLELWTKVALANQASTKH
jgi:hypothetical protein